MSKHWAEEYDWTKHRNRMWGDGLCVSRSKAPTIVPDLVYFVRVCSFTFEFHSIPQIEACLAFYRQKIHPTSRIPWEQMIEWGGDNEEVQRWFDRLPMQLQDNHRRPKVVKALENALENFKTGTANKALQRTRNDRAAELKRYVRRLKNEVGIHPLDQQVSRRSQAR